MEEKAFQYVEFEEISSEEFNGISVGQVAAFGAGVAVGALVITWLNDVKWKENENEGT